MIMSHEVRLGVSIVELLSVTTYGPVFNTSPTTRGQ